LLERVAFSSSLEARTRAEALLQLKTMTGITLAVRQTVIHGFFARDTGAVSSNSKFIENLVAYDLVTMDELARGAANPKWTFDVTEAITKWLGGDNTQNDAAVAVKGLLVALATLSENSRTTPDQKYVTLPSVLQHYRDHQRTTQASGNL
jgi:hypothetical protein